MSQQLKQTNESFFNENAELANANSHNNKDESNSFLINKPLYTQDEHPQDVLQLDKSKPRDMKQKSSNNLQVRAAGDKEVERSKIAVETLEDQIQAINILVKNIETQPYKYFKKTECDNWLRQKNLLIKFREECDYQMTDAFQVNEITIEDIQSQYSFNKDKDSLSFHSNHSVLKGRFQKISRASHHAGFQANSQYNSIANSSLNGSQFNGQLSILDRKGIGIQQQSNTASKFNGSAANNCGPFFQSNFQQQQKPVKKKPHIVNIHESQDINNTSPGKGQDSHQYESVKFQLNQEDELSASVKIKDINIDGFSADDDL